MGFEAKHVLLATLSRAGANSASAGFVTRDAERLEVELSSSPAGESIQSEGLVWNHDLVVHGIPLGVWHYASACSFLRVDTIHAVTRDFCIEMCMAL